MTAPAQLLHYHLLSSSIHPFLCTDFLHSNEFPCGFCLAYKILGSVMTVCLHVRDFSLTAASIFASHTPHAELQRRRPTINKKRMSIVADRPPAYFVYIFFACEKHSSSSCPLPSSLSPFPPLSPLAVLFMDHKQRNDVETCSLSRLVVGSAGGGVVAAVGSGRRSPLYGLEAGLFSSNSYPPPTLRVYSDIE